MSRSSNNELRVFISSTFRDLQEEREHLVKKIFPEIRALCRERGITFTEVDLRWGLTEEDVVLGQVIRTCLEEIDKCRPYFIGITGDRYGYVPELQEYYKDPELLQRWPWIEEAAMESSSIVDLEFRHGLLNGPSSAGDSARFFFRRRRERLDGVFGEDDEQHKLGALKLRVRSAGATVEEFRDPASLGEMIYDELVRIIRRDFTDARPPTPLEAERSKHAAFSASRRRAYIPNPGYLTALNAWLVDEQSSPLVLYAESGSGKSSLVAFWCEQMRRRRPDLFTIEHYVGIGAGDADHLGIIRHIIEEIKVKFDRTEEIPTRPEDLERDFSNWLGFTLGRPVLIIVDGINQLSGRALDLHWLPPTMPDGVRLIISSTVEQTLVDLRSRGWTELGMQPLKEREREAVVIRFLAEYHKALSPVQVKLVAEDEKCSHPLFLRTLLEELRLHGSHEHLERALTALLNTTGTEDLFQRVLERLEDDYSQKVVRQVMTLIWASRNGLSEDELSELTGIGRLKLSTLLLGLDYHLVRRDGLLSFFHDYLRRAVEKRYLSDGERKEELHLRLAVHFERTFSSSVGAVASKRDALELLHHLSRAGERDQLADALSSIPMLLTLYEGETHYDVLSYWSTLMREEDVTERCRRSMETWRSETRSDHEILLVLERLASLLNALSNWRGAAAMNRERISCAREMGDRTAEGRARIALGSSLQLLGENDSALAMLERAVTIAEELGDQQLLSVAIGNMGIMYSNTGKSALAIEWLERSLRIFEASGDRLGVSRAMGYMGMAYSGLGEYDRAIECYEQLLRTSEELGNRHGIAAGVANMGMVYFDHGELDRASECFERSLRIDEELGDRSGVAVSIGNLANVYAKRGEYDRALEYYERQLHITEQIGDRRGTSRAIGDMGVVYAGLGDHDRAIECYERQMGIAEQIGDPISVGRAIGNIGSVYDSQGAYGPALERYHRAVEEHRPVGFRYGLTHWLLGIGQVMVELTQAGASIPEYLTKYVPGATAETWRAMSLMYARRCAEECCAISDELSKPDTQFHGRVLLARIEAAEGSRDAAVKRLIGMLENAQADLQRAEVHYWLWKLGESGHAVDALALYQSICAAAPDPNYRTCIEELKAAVEDTAGGGSL